MDVSTLLTREGPFVREGTHRHNTEYPHPVFPVRANPGIEGLISPLVTMSGRPSKTPGSGHETSRPSPRAKDQKQVTFELLLSVPQSRARLPMRVMISRHDTTDSIITTVKNFYGLYEGRPGVSFQDRNGNILIAAYDNFENGMTVYVKVTPDENAVVNTPLEHSPRHSLSPKKPKLGAPFEMRPPSNPMRNGPQNFATRSPSPSSNRSNRSVSAAPTNKTRSRSHKSQESGNMLADIATESFSDSDGGNGSVSSSRRARAEAHASAEISVDNIVEGGRRKRAKFESSVSVHTCPVLFLFLTIPKGAAFICTSSSPFHDLGVFGVAASPRQWRDGVTHALQQSTYLCLHPTTSFAAKLWKS